MTTTNNEVPKVEEPLEPVVVEDPNMTTAIAIRAAESIEDADYSIAQPKANGEIAADSRPTSHVVNEELLADAPQKPVPPELRQVVTNDCTTEKLACIMASNPRGIIRLNDELAAFIRTMNLYHGGHGADRQFYLSSWAGSTAQIDRKSQNAPLVIREPFVNVLGGIQPDMIGTLEDERGREDGFTHRFLFSFPTPIGRHDWNESHGVSHRIRQVWHDVMDWLFELAMQEPDNDDFGSEPQPRTVRMTLDAEEVWAKWHKAHWDETEWDCFPPHLRGVWSKFEVHALTLVLVAHMLKVACDRVLTGKEYLQRDPQIDAESVQRGLKLADYFKHHNVRVFNRLKVSNEDLRAQQIIIWIRKRPGRRVTPREMHQNGVAGIETTSEARAILKDLADRGYGEFHSEPGKGQRKGEYFQAA